jgi:hypothetical protein
MHYKNFFNDQTLDPSLYIHAHYNREEADWDKLYAKFNAAVDIPTWLWYKDLIKKYPDAKVVLTLRDPDSWYKSVKKITELTMEKYKHVDTKDTLKKLNKLNEVFILECDLLNPETFEDEEYTKTLYRKHCEEVVATVPEDNLLIMEFGEGWERLCRFLGKEMPSVPYPKVNSTETLDRYLNDILENPEVVEQAHA